VRIISPARTEGPGSRALADRAGAQLRSAPVTFAYLAVLLTTSCVLATSSAHAARRLLVERSTNLHQLARDPIRVLISSAFWLPDPWQLPIWAVLFAVVLATVERRLGSIRMGAAFATGHLGASLVTAGGLWLALRADLVDRSVVDVRDVGVSYGFLAVAALTTYLLEPRLRWPYAVSLAAITAVIVAVSGTFTDVGHLCAVLFGFGCYPLARGGG
jgi:Rhomboid-like protein